jgi:hypothetical protein
LLTRPPTVKDKKYFCGKVKQTEKPIFGGYVFIKRRPRPNLFRNGWKYLIVGGAIAKMTDMEMLNASTWRGFQDCCRRAIASLLIGAPSF